MCSVGLSYLICYMFTGIIEGVAEVKSIATEGTNLIFTIKAPFQEKIQVDQSISHNGVCLTVTSLVEVNEQDVTYTVTAVQETLQKTQLNSWEKGTLVNVERSMQVGARIDGHFVQGHVDTVGKVVKVEEVGGSWIYTFSFPKEHTNLLVNKGSICINGVSLTVIDADPETFTVTIIPYTYEHTNFKALQPGMEINLEFDILGKYIDKLLAARMS